MDKNQDQKRSMKLLKEMNNIQDQYIEDAAEDYNSRSEHAGRHHRAERKRGKIRPYVLTGVITAAATLFLTSAVVIGMFYEGGMGSSYSTYSAFSGDSVENQEDVSDTYHSSGTEEESYDASAESGYEQAAASADTYSDVAAENGLNSSSVRSHSSDTEGTDAGSSVSNENGQTAERKLIYTVNYSVETRDMDQLLQTLTQSVQELGGYIESSDFYSDGYNQYSQSSDVSYDSGYRYADLTIRIPADRLDEFRSVVRGDSNVTEETMSTEDITLQYVDTDSHRKALEAEEERLLEMMDSAETVDEMIQIEDKLADVRYQLEDINSQLKLYDNQVDYSTVNISITLTRDYTITDENQSWQDKIAAGFSRSLHSVCEHFKEFCIAFISSLPMILYIIFWIAVIALIASFIVRIIRRHLRRHGSRNGYKEERIRREPPAECDENKDSAAAEDGDDNGDADRKEEKDTENHNG